MHSLNLEQQKIALEKLPLWTKKEDSDAIIRTFFFSDFPTCISFFMRIAFLAEKYDHHPEFAQCYNRLSVLLTTHDVHGLSAKDFAMAEEIDRIFSKD